MIETALRSIVSALNAQLVPTFYTGGFAATRVFNSDDQMMVVYLDGSDGNMRLNFDDTLGAYYYLRASTDELTADDGDQARGCQLTDFVTGVTLVSYVPLGIADNVTALILHTLSSVRPTDVRLLTNTAMVFTNRYEVADGELGRYDGSLDDVCILKFTFDIRISAAAFQRPLCDANFTICEGC